MADGTYRNYLQSIASGTGLPAQEAQGLLQVVGDDQVVNPGFIADPYGYTGNQQGHVIARTNGTGDPYGYGPQGIQDLNAKYAQIYNQRNPALNAAGGGSAGSNDDVSFLNDQEATLRGLLGRTDTGLAQGLTKNQNEYDRQFGGANEDKQRQYANYEDQRVAQREGKQTAQNTNLRNAGNGFRSLAQIIGRAAGTGSSAFRDLLPGAIGAELSSKQRDVSQNFGRNLQGIDKSQGQYDISFQGVLDDLMRQKKDNEERLRTGIEGQRQGINQQLAQNAAQRAQAQGGGYAAVKAAQAPFEQAIDNSRNSVESFFNQFQTPYTPRQAVATAPELSGYTTDRAAINAQQQGVDPNNPYASLLRRKLERTA